MRMKDMVEYLKKQDFDAKMEWNSRTRLYEFEITRYGITVDDDFTYPMFVEEREKDRIQRDFMTNLIRLWHAKAESEKSNTDKKGESNMSDTNKLLCDLAQNPWGTLTIRGSSYTVNVTDITSECSCDVKPHTTITCDLIVPGDPASFIRRHTYSYGRDLPKIKDVIFNPPATIVFWADNTKTVVKCQEGDDFDPEKGLTMAITKKLFGNKGNYCEEIKKWVKKYEAPEVVLNFDFISSVRDINSLSEAIRKGVEEVFGVKKPELVFGVDLSKDPEKRWKIWWKRLDKDGKVVGSGVHHTDYKCKSSARRTAHQLFDDHADIEWTVSQDNPWEEK